MARYRPPAPQGSKYITPEGAAALQSELDRLWRVERPRVTRAVSEAAAMGDRSENAEYIYGKKQLAQIDRRIRYLRKRLNGIRVVHEAPADTGRIYFGAWFTLQTDQGETRTHRLVGPDEIDHSAQHVSMDSPLGKAVLGKTLGAEIAVRTPNGRAAYRIIAIEYREAKKKPGEQPGESQGETAKPPTTASAPS